MKGLYAIYSTGHSCNAYLLVGKKTVMIDSGLEDNEENLKNAFKAIGLKFADVELILHSHGHIDHFSADNLFPKAETWMHEYDGKMVNLKDEGFTARYMFKDHKYPKIKCCVALQNGEQEFDLSPFKLKVLFTPGHTKGSVCFYDEKNKLLFSGDTLFNRAFGRYDLPSGDKKELLASLKSLKKLNYDYLLPGHESILKEGQDKNLDFAIYSLGGSGIGDLL